MRWYRVGCVRCALVALVIWVCPVFGQQSVFTPESIEFFEKKIRPLLHESCLGCHNTQNRTSGLSLESRESILEGGNRGIIVKPGNPEQSTLFRAVNYEGTLEMQ